MRMSFIVIAMFAASLANAAWNSYSEVRELSVDTAGASELNIDAGPGSLTVRGASGATSVQVTATIKVDTRNEDKAQKIAEEDVILTLERVGDRLELLSDVRDGWGMGADISVELDVTMPAGLALRVDDGSGSLTIEDVSADVRVDDGSGSIKIKNVGPLRIDDGSGSIDVVNVSGDASIIDGSGSIKVHGVAGSVTIDDGSGSITVSDVDQDLIIEDDGSGSLNVSNVRGTVEQDT